jgi:hypothetical protein
MSKASSLKASLQSVVRAMLLGGRRPLIFFDSSQIPVLMPTNRNNTVRRVRTIHMFPADENMRRTFRLLVGKTVVVRGSPSVASTAKHHAPIVMHVTKIHAR